MTKRVIGVGRLATFVDTKKHQSPVTRINERMDRLRKHCRAAGEAGRNELNHRDSQIANDRHDDRRG